MFIETQEKSKKDYYVKMLQTIGSLSRLFSESEEPYLFYRVAENLFCKSFNADNLSRSDTSADASLNNIGIGLKTFLRGSGRKMEKVAEFNNDSRFFRNLAPDAQILEIARLRNERIETTKKIYGLNEMIYHCVTRSRGKMEVTESLMRTIDTNTIHKIKISDKSLIFSDKNEEYTFNISKSTLLKRFISNDVLLEFPVQIIDDPFLALEKFFSLKTNVSKILVPSSLIPARKNIMLPLYSTRGNGINKEVPEHSGLNQWNASGRKRSFGEVYIPVPAWIHKKFENFFPPRKHVFNLKLPNKNIMKVMVCQDDGKALMSNPNEALGKWILRDVLGLKEGELLTYKKLEDIGIDSVIISKNSENEYEIDFAKIGSYENFIEAELKKKV